MIWWLTEHYDARVVVVFLTSWSATALSFLACGSANSSKNFASFSNSSSVLFNFLLTTPPTTPPNIAPPTPKPPTITGAKVSGDIYNVLDHNIVPDNGTLNTAVGYQAGTALAAGSTENTVYGHQAGLALSTGDYNTAIGALALKSEDGGSRSVAIGTSALFSQKLHQTPFSAV